MLTWCLTLSFWTAQSDLGFRRWCCAEWRVLCNRYCMRDFCPVFYSWISKQNDFSNFKSCICRMLPQCLPSNFSSIQLTEMSFEEFQDGRHGGHLGYQNRMILAILNLLNTPIPPIKFQFNPTNCLGVVNPIMFWEILAILNLHVAPMPPTNFQLSQTPFGCRCGLKIFTILDIGTEQL